VAGSCRHGKAPSGFMKWWEFFAQWGIYLLAIKGLFFMQLFG
jgi:hypothetical protein